MDPRNRWRGKLYRRCEAFMRIMDFMRNKFVVGCFYSALATSAAANTSRRLRVFYALAALGFVASTAPASVTTLSFQPNPADLGDLNHHLVYTWKINDINLAGSAITSANLSNANISNWDTNPNVLHLHLLDTAKDAGVSSFVDDRTGSTPATDLTDDFVSGRYHNDPNWLVQSGTADTFLANPSFTTTGVNYTLDFTPTQLQSLASYAANGNDIAFGLDPDCHFYNDGLSFTMTLTPVPEMSALYPLLGLIAAIGLTKLLQRRQQLQAVRIQTQD